MLRNTNLLSTVQASFLALSFMTPTIVFAGQKDSSVEALGVMTERYREDASELDYLIANMDESVAKVLAFYRTQPGSVTPHQEEVVKRTQAAVAELASASRARLKETKGRIDAIPLAIVEAMRLAPGQVN